MIEQLRTWVLNIVTLTIFIVLLEIFIPKGKLKKFINLVTGFIIIIAIINPIVSIVKKGFEFRDFHISSSNFIDKREIEQSGKLIKEKQMKQIVDAYRDKVIKQLEDSAREVPGVSDVKADIIFNEDYNSQTFGEIKRVILSLSTNDKENSTKPVVKVEKIEIGKGELEKKESNEVSGEIRGQIEGKISKLFDIHKENIVITASAKSP